MKVFAQVVEAGSFSAAARQLNLPKSSASKYVAQLEDHLGAQLLNRSTRRLSLTEVGHAFYECCAKIVHDVEEAERAVARADEAPQGLLKVNAPMSFGQLQLAPLIAEFLAREPKIRIELALDDLPVNAIAGGFDLTIRVAPPLADSSLIARRLAPNRIVVCAAPSYFARRGVPSTPADLVDHECLLYTYLSSRDTWHFAGAAGEQRVKVSRRLRANNGDALRDAAIQGLGLAQLPTFIVGPDLRSGALEAVLVPYEDHSTAIWAIYAPPPRHLSAKVRAFVDFLTQRLAREPAGETPDRGAGRHDKADRGQGRSNLGLTRDGDVDSRPQAAPSHR
ncbi:MAG TPA: LysR family transcriptional regulator [Myxococcota bacterium]|nr:LysR family transcriptional regulator [Myxococcota bacterium]